MNYVGIDLHKKTITMCTVDQARNILNRKRFFCSDPQRFLAFFRSTGNGRATPIADSTAVKLWPW